MVEEHIITRLSFCILIAGVMVSIFAVLLQEKFLLLAPNMLAPIGLISGIIGFVKSKNKTGFRMIVIHFLLLFWLFLYPYLVNVFINT